jgi:hypothetical protein
MSLTFFFTGAAQGHSLVYSNIIPYFSCFANHYSASVINKEAPANFSPWMDFNTGHKPAYMGNKTGYKKATVPIEKMGYTMMNHRMKTRVTEYYFQYTSGRRISFKHHLNLIPQGLKHMLPPL